MNDSVKQRLIGAIVLLIICASIWPIVFPSAEQPTTVIESLIPEPPPLKIFEMPAQSAPEPVPSIETVLDTARGQTTVTTIDPNIALASLDEIDEAAALPQEEAIDTAVDQALSSNTAWAIQMGAFSSFENAENLAEQMRDKDYSVVVQRRRHNGRQLAFVFLGPYLAQSQALTLAEQLNAAGTEARVVEFTP